MNLDCSLGQLSHLSCPTHAIDKEEKNLNKFYTDESLGFSKRYGDKAIGAGAISEVHSVTSTPTSDSDLSGVMTRGPKQTHYKQDQYVQRLWGESVTMK